MCPISLGPSQDRKRGPQDRNREGQRWDPGKAESETVTRTRERVWKKSQRPLCPQGMGRLCCPAGRSRDAWGRAGGVQHSDSGGSRGAKPHPDHRVW